MAEPLDYARRRKPTLRALPSDVTPPFLCERLPWGLLPRLRETPDSLRMTTLPPVGPVGAGIACGLWLAFVEGVAWLTVTLTALDAYWRRTDTAG